MKKTALVYDWLVTMGGGEKALSAIAEMYPAPIHTLVHDPKPFRGTVFEKTPVYSSFLQKFPFSKRLYRNYLPFFPLAIEQFDLSSYDVIISSSHAVAKGVLTTSNQIHLCYCFTPMRYAWDLTHQYLANLRGLRKTVAKASLHYLRNWDIASASRVDHFATISHYVAARIKKIYGKSSQVIYPPVDVDTIPFSSQKQNYYLTASRMVPYKRLDLIVEAFSHFPDKKLLVVGDGPEKTRIQKLAGKNVELLGRVSDQQLHNLLCHAQAFIFAAEEDFGIAPLEAQAAGTPVIAFGRGGALETVLSEQTGLFFPDQTVESLCNTLKNFQLNDFNSEIIRNHAQKFNKTRFIQEFKQFVKGHI